MMYIRYIGVLCLAILFGCNQEKKECSVSVDMLLKEQPDKYLITDTSHGSIHEVFDKVSDSVRGGNYVFYESGALKSYKFFGSKKGYTYNEEYNPDGTLSKTEGKPLVYYTAEIKGGDSILFNTYFFHLNKKFGRLHVKTNNNENFSVGLEEDTSFSNMLTGAFQINISHLEHVRAFLEINYTNKCIENLNVLRDTIALHYAPFRR